MRIHHCLVNHLTDPLGYEFSRTVFSWQADGCSGSGRRAEASRLVVSCAGETLCDTGWAQLDPLGTELKLPMKPRTRYTWTVSVRTDAGEEASSTENWFETGKMDERWTGRWIGCDSTEKRHPVFSKHISPKGKAAKARLYICGLGLYEAAFDRERIGDEFLTPYCNNYGAWVQAQTYDVTGLLQKPGTLSVTLGNGWYKGRFGISAPNFRPCFSGDWKLIAELVLTYADGTEEHIGTDESWEVTRSRVTFSDIYDGEHRDDTLPQLPPEKAFYAEAPSGRLTDRLSTPVRAYEELSPKELIVTPSGELVIDVGQNITGSFRLRVCEPKGVRIHLQAGEILQHGDFYRENLRSAKAEYWYISDGNEHVLEPQFTFYGYRYMKVEGVPGLKKEDFTALVMHSLLPETGRLETGHRLINRLILNAQWGQKGNFLDVPTDCPQRDERMGWTGDAQVFSNTACFQRDCFAFYKKFLRDMATEQDARGGMVPYVIPAFGFEGCSAAWGDAACVIPWVMYMHYGDKSILRDQLPYMLAWVDYLDGLERNGQGWRSHFHFGDWLAPDGPKIGDGSMGGTDKPFIALAYYHISALLTAKAARAIEDEKTALHAEEVADRALKILRDEYFTPNGRCAVNTQTAYVLAIYYGLTGDAVHAAQVLDHLLVFSKGQLQTGFVGTPHLCSVLSRTGMEDRAFRLLLSEDCPGWLYAVKMGATTVWERWNSVLPDGSVSDTGMNSLNHYAYGCIVSWLYEEVAGIAPLAPGFTRVRLSPRLCKALGRVSASYASASGEWKSSWRIEPDGSVSYRCTVPFGCTAELLLPHGGPARELVTGEYEFTYMPDEPLEPLYSSRVAVAELLDNSRTAPIVRKHLPGVDDLPSYLKIVSLDEAWAQRLKGHIGPEAMDSLNRDLAALDDEWTAGERNQA